MKGFCKALQVGEKGCLLTVGRQRQKKWLGHNATWQFDAERRMDGKRSEGRNI